MWPYLLIFLNSAQACIILSPRSESAWFAAQAFGGYNVVLTTFLAVAGSLAGAAFNYAIGNCVRGIRKDWLKENSGFGKAARLFNRYFIYLVLLQFWSFAPIFILFTGFMKLSLPRVLLFVALGRVAYYCYYIFTA